MNEDYRELIEYLDGKFSKVENDFSDLKKEFNIIQTSVDAYAHKADKFFEELVMWSNQVKRHEKWLQQIADKLGIKLEY